MSKRTFINELGREITIEVERGVLEYAGTVHGQTFRYRIVGPNSEADHTVTRMEGEILAHMLVEAGFEKMS